jgi:hypothetical protein
VTEACRVNEAAGVVEQFRLENRLIKEENPLLLMLMLVPCILWWEM